MRRHIRRALVHLLGWTLVLLGVAGLVLPILPGLLLLLLGLSVLSLEWELARHWQERLRKRWGDERHGAGRIHRLRQRMIAWLPGGDR